jgi:8-oxo-dGTP pyrophosphatase MutT (NUDIX family)
MAEVASRIIEVCPFRIRGDGGEYLLIRRAPDDPLYPGIWQFVSGRVEAGEKAHEAALRELREETGAVPARFWVVPGVSSFYDPHRDAVNLVVLFAAQLEEAFQVRLSPEHSLLAWLPYTEARRRLVWPSQKDCLDIVQQYILGGEEAGTLLEFPA